MATTADNSEYTVRTVNLTKVFGERVSVDSLNLAIRQAELYALLGDNGAGKTTTIGMLTTLLKPTSGDFFIGGFDGRKHPEKIKGVFGIVSQDVAIYQELTAYENLKFIAELYGMESKAADRRIKELLERSELLDRANDRVGEFSGGMQRKLSIAGALLHEPKVLFMDEPTVGLDPASRRQIWSSLIELKEMGVTVLLTTHYLEEAEILADRIGIIRSGRLVVEGTIDDLRHKIRGVRGVSFRLTERLDAKLLEAKLNALKEQFGGDVVYDELRNTVQIGQPENADLAGYMRKLFEWLDENNIHYSRFATSEPNLEEVFLAISAAPRQLDSEEQAV